MLLRIATRSLTRQRRRSLLTGITMVFGYTLISFALSLTEGSYDFIIEEFTRSSSGHVQIHRQGFRDRPKLTKGIDGAEDVLRQVQETPGVVAATPRVLGAALAFAHERSTNVFIRGVDPVLEAAATTLTDRISSGRFLHAEDKSEGKNEAKKEIVLGYSAAESTRSKLGDTLVLISQGADGSIANDAYEIVGIIGKDDTSIQKSNAYMTLKAAQEFFALGKRIHEIAVIAPESDNSRELRDALTNKLQRQDLGIAPWQEIEKEFFRSMEADKAGNVYSLGIILLIVVLGVLNTVLMTVLERTREFGLLRAIGTRPRQIISMILLEISILAFVSCIVGIGLSIALNTYMERVGIGLSSPIDVAGFYWDAMYGKVEVFTILFPAAIVFTSALVVAIFPALRAAHVDPVDAMRAT